MVSSLMLVELLTTLVFGKQEVGQDFEKDDFKGETLTQRSIKFEPKFTEPFLLLLELYLCCSSLVSLGFLKPELP